MENEKRPGKRAQGFPWTPRSLFIFVADYGQPDRTAGGIVYADDDSQFWRYRTNEWRFGEVIGVGGGLIKPDGGREPMPDLRIGDVVMFSRKHGTRLPGDLRYQHPKYSAAGGRGLLIRVLDPDKCQAVCEDFVPWWDVQASQLDPSGILTG